MQPGNNACPSGFSSEYQGYLMASHAGAKRSEYVCVDEGMVPASSAVSSPAGTFLSPTERECGGNLSHCAPYVWNRELASSVCSR